MAKNETSKSKAEIYREERKARIAKAAKQNAKSIEKRTTAASVLKKVVAIVLAVAIVGGIGWKVIDSLGVIDRLATAVKIGDTKISAAQFNYYYSSAYNQIASQASQYESAYGYNVMGFDTSVAPDEQNSTQKDEDGNPLSWDKVIVDTAVSNAQYYVACYNEALKAGIELTEDQKAEIDETIESYREEAAENNYSLNAYLKMYFGSGFNEKVFKQQMEMEMLARNFSEDKTSELTNAVTDKEIAEEYNKDKAQYNYADVRYYAFDFTTLKANDGETEDALKARQKAANDAVIAEAKAVYEKITNEETFISAVKDYENKDAETPSDKDVTTLSKRATKSSLVSAMSEDAAKWAFDNARKAGDKTMITGEKAVYIIMNIKPSYATNSVDVRHCLIAFDAEDSKNVTEEEKKAAYDTAKKLYDEWLAGTKTSESFGTMATENTGDDASAANGGLMENIRISDGYVDAFEEWCFDPARKAGDNGIIETEYGYHIMYFVKNNADDLDWKNSIKTTKANAAATAYEKELLADEGSYAVVENEKWTSKISQGFCDTIRKNLAYNSAR